eukprot:CAMPEP_0196666230 /NCGR_PEP_ID=MMETSP1086-20130531/64384_1 /TAXON_ID=77921 /ORGANISM="Cyanoptyche  gloeocystis , Strain SAG4.97" /LENGTH=74 /DNA_ID=CAMNT_0042003387 /DNA_START=151 /DNA_END=375 /DNA_ORIENTATION=+
MVDRFWACCGYTKRITEEQGAMKRAEIERARLKEEEMWKEVKRLKEQNDVLAKTIRQHDRQSPRLKGMENFDSR